MAKKILAMVILCIGFVSSAQNKQLLYDMVEVPQSLMLNPGMETDFKWHVGVPMLSGISVQAGSNGLSVNDIFANDGIDFNLKVRERVINGMSINDEISTAHQIELLTGGFRGKDPSIYYSFGIYNEGGTIIYWPTDYGILAFEGNADRLDQRFDLGHLKTRGELLNVFHFGMNKKMNDRLVLGARAKLYSSILDFNATSNDGYFVTTEGQNNILASTLSADMQLRTSGFRTLVEADDADNVPRTLLKRGFFGGNLGVGLDLGFTYYLNRQTVLTGSILDLGFIYHGNGIENYSLKGTATIEGVEVILPDALLDPTQDFWQDLVDEVEALVPFDNTSKGYINFRPTKLNASLRHNFGEPVQGTEDCDCNILSDGNREVIKFRNSLGVQLYAINRPRGPQTAITAFYQRRIGNFMAVKTTYTADKYTKTNLGLGASFQAGPVNLYLMADNLLSYRNIAASNYLSFQFGLNIISWGRK